MVGYIILGVLGVFVLYVIFLYNTIITRKNQTENAFGLVDTMLKKRYDLIPNLVETVKQYMVHEATVLSHVTALRAKFSDGLPSQEKVGLYNELSKGVSNLMLSVENYPDLKANQNFLKLQASWNETEEQIAASRRYYNSAVTDFNNAILTFPSNLIAKRLGFTPLNVFEIEANERANVMAKELFN
jgi:Uncharacterized conserved protein